MKEAKVAKQQKRAVTEQKTVENVYPISEKIHVKAGKKKWRRGVEHSLFIHKTARE